MKPSINSAGVTSKAGFGRRGAGRRQRHARDPAVLEAPDDMRHFAGVALLDLDFGEAVADRPVDRSVRRRDIERHAIGARRERLEIGADLVGGVAARGDPIGADDRQIDAPALHEMAAGVVGDDGVRHAVLAEFERGQRRALIARSRLVDEDVHRHAAIMRHVDRRRRRAPIDGRQPSGVAMGQDVDRASALAMDRFDQGQAGFADAPVQGDVLVAEGARARPRGLGAFRRGERRDDGPDVVERIAQVDGGRPARQQGAIGAPAARRRAPSAAAPAPGHKPRSRRSAGRRAPPWS